jgi:two-component sensor histidine kinase/DNA-binding response OmpR family regulator
MPSPETAGVGAWEANAPVNILLVDDQPAKLTSYEAILRDLGETLIKAASARQALEILLREEVAAILVDVCMPELDGFDFAEMVRAHPRFQKTAIIFISAVHLTELDVLRGYEMGAVDYVPVPVVPEVLRAKIKVFVELYRKSRQLEELNRQLERRVVERTGELEAANARLLQSEQLRNLALGAGQMGSWDWDVTLGRGSFDAGQCRIFGVDPETFNVTLETVKRLIADEDIPRLTQALESARRGAEILRVEFRAMRPGGELRSCIGLAAVRRDRDGRIARLSGVTVDQTEQENARAHEILLTKEVDHRARNALAVVQAIIRLTRAESQSAYMAAVEGRIGALSRTHALLSQSRWEGADLASIAEQEMAPYRSHGQDRVRTHGSNILLPPAIAQTIGLALHELATNAVKHGALSVMAGSIDLTWQPRSDRLELHWTENGGPPTKQPQALGYGVRTITAAVERQLEGKAQFEWSPEGLRCRLSLPLTRERPSDSPPRSERTQRGERPHLMLDSLRGRRLLVVEDEMLVAMMIRDTLTELGFEVIGPFGTLEHAFGIAATTELHAAILDVNVGGKLVYPLADMLETSGVPVAFVTGYALDAIEPRFANAPAIQKPIDPVALQGLFPVSSGSTVAMQDGATPPLSGEPIE